MQAVCDFVHGHLDYVIGSSNPVAGPYFNFTVPEPTGVVAIVAPQESSLLGFASVVAPALVSGNTVVGVGFDRDRLIAAGYGLLTLAVRTSVVRSAASSRTRFARPER